MTRVSTSGPLRSSTAPVALQDAGRAVVPAMVPVRPSSTAPCTTSSAWPIATPRRNSHGDIFDVVAAVADPRDGPVRLDVGVRRTSSRPVAFVTPRGARSVRAVQPTAYVTSCRPSRSTSSWNCCSSTPAPARRRASPGRRSVDHAVHAVELAGAGKSSFMRNADGRRPRRRTALRAGVAQEPQGRARVERHDVSRTLHQARRGPAARVAQPLDARQPRPQSPRGSPRRASSR